MPTVPQLVRMIRDRYIKTQPGFNARTINTGQCEDFAQDLIELLPGATSNNIVESTLMLIDDKKKLARQNIRVVGDPLDLIVDYKGTILNYFPGHYWVLYKGRHYDAECPLGVTNWLELPLFKRALKKARGR